MITLTVETVTIRLESRELDDLIQGLHLLGDHIGEMYIDSKGELTKQAKQDAREHSSDIYALQDRLIQVRELEF